jgi:dipeptidase
MLLCLEKSNNPPSLLRYRTSDSYVVQSKNDSSIGAVLWFGPASALGTVFTPFVLQIDKIPASFSQFYQGTFSRASAFWAACYAHNMANLKWNYAIRDLQDRQNSLERASIDLMQTLEKDFGVEYNFNYLESAVLENAAKVVHSLWNLSDEIMFKYASGFVNQDDDNGGMSQMVGYPRWWLEAVGYRQGPPPPPTQPKCCNPPKSNMSNKPLRTKSEVVSATS